MPKLAAADAVREMSSETPPGLCYICGEDGVAVSQTEQRILKKLTDGDAMAYTAFDGQNLDLERLTEACGFCPMFQPFNVILIRDLDGDSMAPSDMDTLLKLWETLPPRVVVLAVIRAIPVYEVKRGAPVFLQKQKKITSFFEKNGILCICEKKNVIQLGKQIQERAKRHGCEISREDAELLANRCLCDSTLIRSELDKLMACADGEPITFAMIDALTVQQPDADAFRLARAVTAADGKTAFRLLQALTAKSEDSKTILGLLSILSGTFTDLYRARLGLGASRRSEDVTADFGYPKNREFAVRNAMRDCKTMTIPQLRACIRILRETDRACKSSRTAPRLLLEQAIVRMLRIDREGREASR